MLYKSINWKDIGSSRFLTHNELFFYSAKEWEKDGEYHFDLANYNQAEVEDIILEIAIHLHNTNKREYLLWMDFHSQKFGLDLNSLSQVDFDLADQYLAKKVAQERVDNPQEFIAAQKNIYFERTGIFSLSRNKYSYALWNSKRNVSDDNIVCVGIEEQVLIKEIRKVANCFLNNIEYSNQLHKYIVSFDTSGFSTLFQLLSISFLLPEKLKMKKRFEFSDYFLIPTLIVQKEKYCYLTRLFVSS